MVTQVEVVPRCGGRNPTNYQHLLRRNVQRGRMFPRFAAILDRCVLGCPRRNRPAFGGTVTKRLRRSRSAAGSQQRWSLRRQSWHYATSVTLVPVLRRLPRGEASENLRGTRPRTRQRLSFVHGRRGGEERQSACGRYHRKPQRPILISAGR